jgi:hypothetical protein
MTAANDAPTLGWLLREGAALMLRAPLVWLGLLVALAAAYMGCAALILIGVARGGDLMALAISGAGMAGVLLTALAFVPPLCTGWMAHLACERAGVTPASQATLTGVLWSSFVVGIAATVGFQLLIGPGMWVMASMGQSSAVVACEGAPAIDALTRSRALSEPARKPLMWVQVGVLLSVIPVTIAAAMPISWEVAQTSAVEPARAASIGLAWFIALALPMLYQGAISAAAYAWLRAAELRA